MAENILYKETTSNRGGYFSSEFEKAEVIHLDNGEFLIRKYGKYSPNLTFVVDECHKNIVWSDMTTEEQMFINIHFDGTPAYMVGDFWISKKGTKCFRPKKDGKHILIRNDWGGCFESSRGREWDELKEDAAILYRRYASSNGGGTGYTFYVLPRTYQKVYSIEDI